VRGRGRRYLQSLKGQPLGARWPALTGGTVTEVEDVGVDTVGIGGGSVGLDVTA
jgi:hypothetical protein